VIGHRGAAAVAPENTLASLQAAVAAGAHLVEFDVGADLRLAHSPAELPDAPVTLDEALAYLREQPCGIHLDAKGSGHEAELLAALRRHGVEGRTVVSSTSARSLRRIARLAPALGRAIGYPNDRYGVSGLAWPGAIVRPAAAVLRGAMPARIPLLLRGARANAISLHHTLCSRAAVRAAHRLGAPVLAWTANDEHTVRRLAAAGVDAIVTDDPRSALQVLATLTGP
jgi:glycerophosphoryl diester phosphodiesterase